MQRRSVEHNRGGDCRAGWIPLVGRLLVPLAVLFCGGGCALYSEGDPADAARHVVRGQSVRIEQTFEFYIASSREIYFTPPTDQVEPLFAAPKWVAPPGVKLTATSVGRIEPAQVKWRDAHMEYTASGYRIRLSCDCFIQETAPPGLATVGVSFDHLNDELGRDTQNNPKYARFVTDYKEGRLGINEPVPVAALRVYETQPARTFRLYRAWLAIAGVAIIVVISIVLYKTIMARVRG